MDVASINQITSIIGTLGFPIVCCYFLWRYINETMKEFTKSLNEQVSVLNKMCEKMDCLKSKIGKGEDNE